MPVLSGVEAAMKLYVLIVMLATIAAFAHLPSVKQDETAKQR